VNFKNSNIKGKKIVQIGLFLIWAGLVSVVSSVQASEKILEVGDVSLSIDVIDAMMPKQVPTTNKKTQARLLWLPSEYGVLPQEKAMAEQLSQYGIESWFVDYYDAMFLSPTPSTVDKINPQWTQKLIELAREDVDVPVWIIAPNKAAQIAVKGLQKVLTKPIHNLGLILINPNLYIETPQPGLVADYWPETSNINLPITIIQAELSPWKWRLTPLTKQLSLLGSDVFTQIITEVRDRFYFRPDALDIEKHKANKMANNLLQSMRLQLAYFSKPRRIKTLSAKVKKPVKQTRTLALSDYKGKQNLPLALMDINNNSVDLQSYKGKVVLVNFWASWCPPCVHEMPSMARLKSHYAKRDFEILAVNLGEQKEQVVAFLKEHPVNFPVLLDSDALAVKQWNVFAYPSSYLIDKKGKIQFALFGGTEWDDKQYLDKIEILLTR
jgi:thiol-disulfide isomerase/thioredoxin